MKQGEAVFLATQPDLRGNVGRIGPDWFEVTWHPFVVDRPEAVALRVLGGRERTRVRYNKADANNVGFGNPN
jgi:hypothetical protein